MIMTRRTIALSAILLLSAAAPGFAQSGHSGHDMGGMSTSEGASSPAAKAYIEAMDKMHEAMGKMEYSGNADVDFARGMIPHHQAAIDMAKIQLEHGKDPELRKLSEEIIAAQEREIKQLEDWLAAHQPK